MPQASLEILCKKYTNLSPDDVAALAGVAANLPLFSQLIGADLFVDCLIKNGQNAVVVAEWKPEKSRSVISKSVLGEIVDKSREPAVLRTLHSGLESKNFKSLTIEQQLVSQSAAPIFNDSGQIIGALISETFLPEYNERSSSGSPALSGSGAEQAPDSPGLPLNSLLALIQPMNDAIIIFDRQWRVIHCNRVAVDFYKTLGYMDDIRDMHIGNLILDREIYDAIKRKKRDIGQEITHGSMTLHLQCVFINHGSEANMALIISDLSELRAKDRELILKSVAMREIHHRIKNNLQTVASILRLQVRRSRDENIRQALNENICRILSIATTHEIMAQKELDCLEINALLGRIKDNILRYGLSGSKNIEVAVSGDAFQVMSSVATTVALVVNELLSNALEHAFVRRSRGEVLITISYGRPKASIVVEDDGAGFDIAKAHGETLGFGIVRALIKDTLNGEMAISSNKNGSRIEFTFNSEITSE